MGRPSKDEWGLMVASVTAKRSTCLRRSVGAVLVNKRGHVLATGYNGVASGLPHCNHLDIHPAAVETFFRQAITPHACPGVGSASGTNLDGCHAIHAEQNALLQCKGVYEIETCYVTTSPCVTCTKLLLNTSCQRIVFMEEYPQPQAEALWTSAGREWIYVPSQGEFFL